MGLKLTLLEESVADVKIKQGWLEPFLSTTTLNFTDLPNSSYHSFLIRFLAYDITTRGNVDNQSLPSDRSDKLRDSESPIAVPNRQHLKH